MVPRFLQLAHLEEAILIWHLSIGRTKSTKNIIKPVARHDTIGSKCSTFSHRWCRRGPPVPTTLDSNPSCHVEPTTNPLYKLSKTHWRTQPLVGIGNEYLIKIVLWDYNQKQPKQWHTKDGVVRIISERSERILKVAGFPGENNTLSPPIIGARSSIILSRDIIWCWTIIIINIYTLTAKICHVFRT